MHARDSRITAEAGLFGAHRYEPSSVSLDLPNDLLNILRRLGAAPTLNESAFQGPHHSNAPYMHVHPSLQHAAIVLLQRYERSRDRLASPFAIRIHQPTMSSTKAQMASRRSISEDCSSSSYGRSKHSSCGSDTEASDGGTKPRARFSNLSAAFGAGAVPAVSSRVDSSAYVRRSRVAFSEASRLDGLSQFATAGFPLEQAISVDSSRRRSDNRSKASLHAAHVRYRGNMKEEMAMLRVALGISATTTEPATLTAAKVRLLELASHIRILEEKLRVRRQKVLVAAERAGSFNGVTAIPAVTFADRASDGRRSRLEYRSSHVCTQAVSQMNSVITETSPPEQSVLDNPADKNFIASCIANSTFPVQLILSDQISAA